METLKTQLSIFTKHKNLIITRNKRLRKIELVFESGHGSGGGGGEGGGAGRIRGV